MDDITEALSIPQRMKRSQNMRRNEGKLKRAKKIAERRPADKAHLKKRALAAARQIVRKRFAGKKGAEYEDLSPSEKISIDKTIENKQKLIKKLALRLIPKIRLADSKRLSSMMHSGNKLPPSTDSALKENVILDALFFEEFKSKDGKRDDSKSGKNTGKSPNVEILGRLDSKIKDAIGKKSDKSGICEEVLFEVYRRGLDVWNEDIKVSPEQYAFARVNSFINRGKTYFNEDSDLVTELSKKTLGSYIKKAGEDRVKIGIQMARAGDDFEERLKAGAKNSKRRKGLNMAVDKLTEEDIEESGFMESVDLNEALKVGQQVWLKNKTKVDSPTGGKIHSIGPNHVIIKRFGGAKYKAHIDNITPHEHEGFAGKAKAAYYSRNEETIHEISDSTKSSYKEKAKNQKDAEELFYDADHHAKIKARLGSNDPVVKNYDKAANTIRKRTAGLKKVSESHLIGRNVILDAGKKVKGKVISVSKDTIDVSTPNGVITGSVKKATTDVDADAAQRLKAMEVKRKVIEDVYNADKVPVVVPSYKVEYGNTIPAKTVMRKQNKKIIKTGNVHDGKDD